jgi:hypothetical protein
MSRTAHAVSSGRHLPIAESTESLESERILTVLGDVRQNPTHERAAAAYAHAAGVHREAADFFDEHGDQDKAERERATEAADAAEPAHMTHLSLAEGDTEWGEHVTDAEYGSG